MCGFGVGEGCVTVGVIIISVRHDDGDAVELRRERDACGQSRAGHANVAEHQRWVADARPTPKGTCHAWRKPSTPVATRVCAWVWYEGEGGVEGLCVCVWRGGARGMG